jgi:hypothetical protein
MDRRSHRSSHRDEPRRDKFNQSTKLIRDHPTRPSQSQQNRDEPSRNDFDQRTKLIRDHGTRPSQSQPHRQETSRAPSILRTNLDETMASRQTRIQTLAPVERQEQEQWAQKQVQLTGACVGKYAWTRVEGGYRCGSGNCKVTDELLAEGKGGYLMAYPHINSRHPDLFDENGITWLGPGYRGHRMQAPR